MEKETKPELFSHVANTYSSLELIDNLLLPSHDHELSRTRTLRKYGLPSFLNIVDMNVALVSANGQSALIKSTMYHEYAQVLQKEAEKMGRGHQAELLYKHSALLYIKSAIEIQGVTAENAHAVVHCLSQLSAEFDKPTNDSV